MSGRASRPEPLIDTSTAHPARVYDYLLGGTDNFKVDRQLAEHVFGGVYPGGMRTAMADVRANRDFLGRAVRYLANDAGVRQFLDIGTGIPAADGNSVHEVAQQIAAESRVVYVDNDPVVLAHAHALLDCSPEGTTAYVDGDLRDPDDILELAGETLDLTEPVALLLVGVLHFIAHDEDPYDIVSCLLNGVPTDSHLVISHLANDINAAEMAEVTRRSGDQPVREEATLRNRREIARFFDGLELVEPGLVRVDEWRAAPKLGPNGWLTPICCGVARKL